MTRPSLIPASDERIELTLTVHGPRRQVAAFVKLCRTIHRLCSIGSSRTLHLAVDGDGDGALRFTIPLNEVSGFDTEPVNAANDPVWVGGIT